MKLSELVYECVKNVKYLDDPNFTYESFMLGDYDNDMDYSNSINNVFTPLNTAIHRLSDRRKIKNEIVLLGALPINRIFDISDFKLNIKKVLNIFCIDNNNYRKIEHRELGKDKIFLPNASMFNVYYMEYVQDIKRFNKSDFYKRIDDEGNEEVKDIELKDYGITDTMTSYIIEFVKGLLLETIAPEMANMHRVYAEQYFDDLEEQQTLFNQNKINNVLKMY